MPGIPPVSGRGYTVRAVPRGYLVAERVCKSYKALVGMEIHVQLATRSKMFTGAANAFGAEPNTLVDAQVLGLPGVLPVMNRRAVEFAILVGLALNCRIARFTKWDRKSYYYPDLPKNYQISQYDLPLCAEGCLEVEAEDGSVRRIRIRRAHLEEDAGKLLHEAPGGYPIDYTIVDLNRAGTPLLEIVTEPDLASPRDVASFAQELQRIVQYLGVSQGHMQMGHMRFEPNVNVHITDQAGQLHKTAITEIKNLNSFAALEKATAYEIQRQIRQWEQTGSLGRRSTCGWDETRGATVHQRDKEEAHDYRYFPDPDLPPVVVDDAWLEQLRACLGELPAARRRRYVQTMGLKPEDASVLTMDRGSGELFEQSVAAGANPRRVAGLLLSHGRRIANRLSRPLGQVGFDPRRIAELANLIDQGRIAPAEPAGQVLERTLETDASVEQIASEMNLLQSSDMETIDAAIEMLIAENPRALQDYKAGRQAAFGALVGTIMRACKGLNPRLVQQRLKVRLMASDHSGGPDRPGPSPGAGGPSGSS